MAELGIAASGIGIASLALQVGDCIVRLKSFCDAVKDAPEEIKHLIEAIETLSLVLSEFETNDQADLGQESSACCLLFCRKAKDALEGVVREVEGAIGKSRRLGSMKAVLKRDVIEKLKGRLGTAQSMLMLSSQVYLVALQKRNHRDWAKSHQEELQQLKTIFYQSKEIVPSSTSAKEPVNQGATTIEIIHPGSHQSKPLESTNQSKHNYPRSKGLSKRQNKLKARFLTPKWLFGVSRAIEIYESRARAGWNFSIQVYNIVPGGSPVFLMASKGNVVGIQQLFSTGKASPFDRNESGWTVLDIAAMYHKLGVCRLLINEGADSNISGASSALMMSFRGIYVSKGLLDLIRFLAQEIELQDPFDDEKEWRRVFCDAAVFSWILQQSNSNYEQRSLEECVLFAIRVYHHFQRDMASLIRLILKGRTIDATLCCIRDQRHNTLLHRAAWHLGDYSSFKRVDQRDGLDDLLSLISDLIKGGSELHSLTLNGRTPMIEVLEPLIFWVPTHFTSLKRWHCGFPSRNPGDPIPLSTWLKQLKDSGVDLVRYGKEERDILESPEVRREFRYKESFHLPNTHHRRFHTSKLRLINFTYGLELEDWNFWFAPVMEDYFIQFWEMVDHPEWAMPGAWEEEYSDDDDDDYECTIYPSDDDDGEY